MASDGLEEAAALGPSLPAEGWSQGQIRRLRQEVQNEEKEGPDIELLSEVPCKMEVTLADPASSGTGSTQDQAVQPRIGTWGVDASPEISKPSSHPM